MKINEWIPDDYGFAEGFQPEPYSDLLDVKFNTESVSEMTEIIQDGKTITLTRMQVDELISILEKIKRA